MNHFFSGKAVLTKVFAVLTIFSLLVPSIVMAQELPPTEETPEAPVEEVVDTPTETEEPAEEPAPTEEISEEPVATTTPETATSTDPVATTTPETATTTEEVATSTEATTTTPIAEEILALIAEEPEIPYAPYCGDGEVNQDWEQCDGDAFCTEQCLFPVQNQCPMSPNFALARINITDFNNEGAGDVSDDSYVRPLDGLVTTRLHNNTWFPILDDEPLDDFFVNYQDVPGVAIRRAGNNELKLRLFGNHPIDDGSIEHIAGFIEFFGATTTGQINDGQTGQGAENPTNGSHDQTGSNDEFWLDSETGNSSFDFTVNTQNDSFFTTYQFDNSQCVLDPVDDEDGGFIQGQKYRDVNQNHNFDEAEKTTENRLDDWRINLFDDSWTLVDTMLTGDLESRANPAHASSTETVIKNQYRFNNLADGTYYVCEEYQDDWAQITPRDGVRDGSINPSNTNVSTIEDPNSEGNYCYQVAINDGKKQANIRFGNIETPEEPTFLKVKIYKYLDGVQANAETAGGYLFPMKATWDDEINDGLEADYTLGTSWGGADQVYAAFTREMSVPTNLYSTREVTSDEEGASEDNIVLPIGATCEADKYRLAGYTTGDSLQAAETAEITSTIPAFSNITTDKYVVVWNEDCDNVLAGTNKSVSGAKFNDEDGDGVWDSNEDGLAGWEITIAKLVQNDLAVSGVNTVTPSITLENLTNYFINATGTYYANDSITADAMYSVREPNTEWTDVVQNYEGYGPTLLDLQINGVTPGWGPYNSNHSYWTTLIGTGLPISLATYDLDGGSNNSGNLLVNTYEVVATTTTSEDGSYSFAGLESGTYVIRETNQEGWTQTFPSGDGSHIINLDSENNSETGVDFGNQEIDPPVCTEECESGTGAISGYKWEDEDGDAEWDEGEGGLANWTITLTNTDTEEVVSTTTNESGAFSFNNLVPGHYRVAEEMQNGYLQTYPTEGDDFEFTITSESNITNVWFGNKLEEEESEPELRSSGGGGGGSGGCRPCYPCDNLRLNCTDSGIGGTETDAGNTVDNAGGQGGAEGGLALLTDGNAGDTLALGGDATTTASTTASTTATTTDDETNNQLAAVGSLGSLFGISWWWWILILILLGIIGYYTFRDKENY